MSNGCHQRRTLWRIVEGTEVVMMEVDTGYAKYMSRRDRALAVVVLSVDLSLLYLTGEPDSITSINLHHNRLSAFNNSPQSPSFMTAI